MSVGRRGAADGELLTKTVFGNAMIGFDGANPVTNMSVRLYDIAPPPGQDWEVHEVTQYLVVRVRNPTTEEPSAAPAVVANLTFGNEPWDDYSEDVRIRPSGIDEGVEDTNRSGAIASDDQSVLFQYGDTEQSFMTGDQITDITAATPSVKFIMDETADYRNDPLTVNDLQEMTVFVAADYPSEDTIGGGEENLFVYSSTQIRYKPM